MADKSSTAPLGTAPLGGMLDSMEFVRQAWTNFSLPRAMQPTMDLDEIDRRIADLKVVEQWLTVNLNMLRGSIQGMEVQRSAISTLQAFGQSMTQPPDAVKQGQQTKPEASPTPSGDPLIPESLGGEMSKAAIAAASPNAWWQLLQSQFNQLAQAALAGSNAAATSTPAPATATRAAAPRSTARTSGGDKPSAPAGTSRKRAAR